jgi:hypothetical protein
MSSSFTKNIISYYNNNPSNFKFKPEYKKFLYDIYENIKKYYSTGLNIKFVSNIDQDNEKIRQIKNFINYESKFMSKKIRNSIKKYVYAHKISTENIDIIYFSKKNDITTTQKRNIKQCIYRICCIKKYINNDKDLTIAIYPTQFKKGINKITKKIKPLDIDNVNSGLTYYSNSKNGTIILWRTEEIKKVIIHELFHSLKVDYGLIIHEKVFDAYMKDVFKLDQFIGINESYVETLACIFNTIFVVIEHQYAKSKILYYLNIEIFYCTRKMAQILNYYHFSSLHELMTTKVKYFKQNSNIFSYYILKTLILYNFDDILKKLINIDCIDNNILIKTKTDCSEKYLDLIKAIYNTKVDITIRNIIENNDFINSSLRMTCIE